MMQVRLTDSALTEVLPRISDADVQISRQRITAFLTMHTAYELLPESGKVWMFKYVELWIFVVVKVKPYATN